MDALEAPKSKLQIPGKIQSSNPQGAWGILSIGVWDLFEP